MRTVIDGNTSRRISLLSFICTGLIVIYHSSGIAVLGNIAMSYFWSTSAFFLYLNLSKDNIRTRIIKRVGSLLLPYLLWNIIYYFLNIVFQRPAKNEGSIVLRMLFDPYDGPLWYLFALFIITLFSPLVLAFIRKRGKILAAVCFIICWLLGVVFKESIEARFQYGFYFTRLFRYLPSYVFGAAAAVILNKYGDSVVELFNKNTISIACSCIVLVGFIIVKTVVWPQKWGQTVCFIVSPFLPISLWILFDAANVKESAFLCTIIPSAFYIYALHSFEISLFSRALKAAHSPLLNMSVACEIVIIPSLCVGASYLSWRLMNRFSPKFAKMLSGGR